MQIRDEADSETSAAHGLDPEREPLLRSRESHDQPVSTGASVQPEPTAEDLQKRITILVAILTATLEIPLILLLTSETRVFELILCRQYYAHVEPGKIGAGGRVPEQFCKIGAVQAQVANLRGGQQFFQNLPSLFLAIPYGTIADKYGRKWLLVLNAVSLLLRAIWVYIVCAFPLVFDLKLVWMESIFVILGGGLMVTASLMFTVLADVTPNADRASVFFRIMAVDQICSTVGPFLTAALMKKDPWIAFALGVSLHVLSIPVTLFIPETLSKRHCAKISSSRRTSSSQREPSSLTSTETSSSFTKAIKGGLVSLKQYIRILCYDWRVITLSCVYPFRMANVPLDAQLLQYVPQRYHLRISTTALLQSLQAFLSSLVLLFLLPLISSWLLTRHHPPFSPMRKDILFVRVGFLFHAFGWLIIGFAPRLFVLVLGLGVSAFMAGAGGAVRAAITTWVSPDEVGRLYSVLGVLECLGLMGAGPAIAGLFNAGLRTGKDIWLGLPWIVNGVAMLGIVCVLWALRWETSTNETANPASVASRCSGSKFVPKAPD